MYTSEQRLAEVKAEVRALTAALDKLSRTPRRFSPSAPWYIPAVMIVVGLFALICLVIKLFMNYLNSKNNKTKKYGLSETSSPEIPTTPEDQTSMATTASMKTRGSLRLNSKHKRNRLQPVSLYQLKQKQSPSSSSSKSKSHKAAMKAISRAAKAEANRSLSRDSTRQVDDDDNINNDDNSPTNLSQHSDDTDEIKVTDQPGLLYGAAMTRDETDGVDAQAHSAQQPEVHIVQIRDLGDNLQHPEPAWPQAESEI